MTSWEEINRLKGVFDRFDKDENGSIDREEFGEFLEAIGKSMSKEQLAKGFEEIDVDGSGVIEFKEFVAWWENRQ